MTSSLLNERFFEGMDRSIQGINNSETLPPEVYATAEFFEFERQAVFSREWLCVGRESWAAEPGDFFTTTQGGEPLIIARNRDGQLLALSAVCQHRAMLVAEGSGNTKLFRCPYHHWSYALDGTLIGAPAMEKACNFNKKEYSLPQVKLEVWLGFVFVNFDMNAEPLAPKVKALADTLANYDLANTFAPKPTVFENLPWNWKVMFENANDGYHANRLHRGPMHDICPSDLCTFPELPEDTSAWWRYNGTTHIDASFNPTLKTLLPVFPGLTEEERHRMLFCNVSPTLTLYIRADLAGYFILHANGASSTTVEQGSLVHPTALADRMFKEKLAMNHQASQDIAAQDRHVDTLVQRGLNSRFAPRGRYSWQETTHHQFNKWLVKRYQAQWRRMAGPKSVPVAA